MYYCVRNIINLLSKIRMIIVMFITVVCVMSKSSIMVSELMLSILQN